MEKQYLYESHLGGYYTAQKKYDRKELYCEQCGDSDWFLGSFSTPKELWDIVRGDVDVDGCGGICLAYIYHFIDEVFNANFNIKYQFPDWSNDKCWEFVANTDDEMVKEIEEFCKNWKDEENS